MYLKYEVIRNVIDEGKISELDRLIFEEIVQLFEEGIKKYWVMFKKVSILCLLVKVMGIYKNFEKVYFLYVVGCEEMI